MARARREARVARREDRLDRHRKVNIVRNYAKTYQENHPDETSEQIVAAVRLELEAQSPEDFGPLSGFDWNSILKMLLDLLKNWLGGLLPMEEEDD